MYVGVSRPPVVVGVLVWGCSPRGQQRLVGGWSWPRLHPPATPPATDVLSDETVGDVFMVRLPGSGAVKDEREGRGSEEVPKDTSNIEGVNRGVGCG